MIHLTWSSSQELTVKGRMRLEEEVEGQAVDVRNCVSELFEKPHLVITLNFAKCDLDGYYRAKLGNDRLNKNKKKSDREKLVSSLYLSKLHIYKGAVPSRLTPLRACWSRQDIR